MPEKLSFIERIFSLTVTAMSFWALVLSLSLVLKEVVQFVNRKYFSKPKLKSYLPNNFEVGFGKIGASFTLDLTLLSEVKDSLITNIVCIVRNLRTQESHEFSWFLFNEYRADPSNPDDVRLRPKENASPFYVPTNSIHKMNVSFFEEECRQQILDIFRRAIDSIRTEHRDMLTYLDDEEIKNLYEESDVRTQTYSAVDRLFYWGRGNYELVMHFDVAGASKSTVARRFSINEEEEALLRLNIIHVTSIEDAESVASYNFIRPALSEE